MKLPMTVAVPLDHFNLFTGLTASLWVCKS